MRNIMDSINKVIALQPKPFENDNKFAIEDGLYGAKIVAAKISLGVETTFEGTTKTQNQIQFVFALDVNNGFGIASTVLSKKFNMVINDKSSLCKTFAKVHPLSKLEDVQGLLEKDVQVLISTNGDWSNIANVLPAKTPVKLGKVYLPTFFKENGPNEMISTIEGIEEGPFNYKEALK
jgi:hypothetical protein